MNPKFIYSMLLGVLISLIPNINVNASEIAPFNSTDTNTTTTATETTREEIIPDPPVEGEREPIQDPAPGSQSDWTPMVVDWWDDKGLHGETIYYNQKTGETREPLPYRNGLPLCHDDLYVEGLLGNRCYDELDHDTCEDGFIDRGFGCEPENGNGTVPQTCPPTCPNDEDLPPVDDGGNRDGNGNGNDDDNNNDNDNGNEDPEPNPPEDDFLNEVIMGHSLNY